MELSERQMYEVDGGIGWGVIAGIAAAIVYIIGVISGYTNPTKCSN